MPGCWNAFAQAAHGTKGTAEIQGHGPAQIVLPGREPLRFERGPDGHQLEMDHLFAALLAGEPYNEGDWATESTMTAILGRMATYSGKEVDWETAMNSDLELGPKQLSWDSPPPVRPNEQGFYPVCHPRANKGLVEGESRCGRGIIVALWSACRIARLPSCSSRVTARPATVKASERFRKGLPQDFRPGKDKFRGLPGLQKTKRRLVDQRETYRRVDRLREGRTFKLSYWR